jgi:hypothetical protein
MTSVNARTKPSRRNLILVGFAALVTALGLEVVTTARADSTPVGRLPPGPLSTITTGPDHLIAVALPHASKKSGLSWRLARRYDSRVLREISEADVGTNVVVYSKSPTAARHRSSSHSRAATRHRRR